MFKKKGVKFLAFIFAFLLLLTSCQELGDQLSKPENQELIKNTIEEVLKENNSGKGEINNGIENSSLDNESIDDEKESSSSSTIDRDGAYYTKEDVAQYLIEYGELPENYLTKSEARKLGWDASSGNLWDVTDRGVIGGDRFGNREGILPRKNGRQYYEADVNYEGGRRNAHRLVYSNDGLVYYTGDHYASFEKLAGEEWLKQLSMGSI